MTQTILDLWNGDITPCERCGAKNPQINELLGLMERNRNDLQEGLTAAQTEVFQKYMDAADEYLLLMLEHAFCDGFRLGGRLAVETLT